MKATRIFNLPTPTLAAVLSVLTYAVLFGLATLGKFTGTGRKMDPAVQLFLFLHTIPEWLMMSSVKRYNHSTIFRATPLRTVYGLHK